MGIAVTRLSNRMAALGAAAHFVTARPPFAAIRADALVRTLHGQVERGHYFFALEARRVRGYIGWAMLDAAAAARVVRSGGFPSAEDILRGGDIVWVLTVVALDRAAVLACVNGVRALHPGRRMMGVRHRPDGTIVVFDQPIRRRGGAPPAP